MQNSIWKLTALAGVIGIGCLVVMQAMRGLSEKDTKANGQTAAIADFESEGQVPAEAMQLGQAVPLPEQGNIGFGQLEPQSEPASFDEPFPASPGGRTVAATENDSPFPDSDRTAPQREPEAFPSGPARPLNPDEFSRSGPTSVPVNYDEPPRTVQNAAAIENDDPFGPSADAGRARVTGFDEAPAMNRSPAPASSPVLRLPAELPDNSPAFDDPNPFGPQPVAESPNAGPSIASPGPQLLGPNVDDFADSEPPQRTRPRLPPAIEVEENPFGNAPPRPVSVAAPEPVENPFGNSPAGAREIEEAPFGPRPASEVESAPRAIRRPEPVPFRTSEIPASNTSPTDEGDVPGFGSDGSLAPIPETVSEPQPVPVPQRQRFGDAPELRGFEDRAVAPTAAEDPPLRTRPSRPEAIPNQLQPPPEASRLVPATPDDLLGDGTINRAAPRGIHRPQLSIEKSAPPNAVLGQPLIYTILVRNSGNTPAQQVVVEDEIPKGTQLSGTIPQAELVEKKLVWQLGTLKPNEERKIQVRIVPLEEGQVGSIATVNFVSEVAAETRVISPRVTLELTGPKQATLGQPVTFRFKVVNNGAGDANGVLIRNLIPDELKHPSGNDLEYEVGTLRAGEAREINLAVTPIKIGRTTNRALATYDGGGEVSADAELEVTGSKITLTRSGPRQRYLGRPATFINKVTNDSAVAIGNLTVVETIPAGMDFVRTGNGGQYNTAKRTVAWSIPSLGPNESKELEVVLVPKTAGTQNSNVTVFDQQGQRVQVDSATSVGGIAALSASTGGIEGPLALGDTIKFQVKVKNRGTKSASNVGLRVIVPEELEVVSAQGPDRYSARFGDISFLPVAALAPQQESTYTLVLKALRPGDVRLKLQIDADDMQLPLNKEEAIVIFSE